MDIALLVEKSIEVIKISWEFSNVILVPEFIPSLLISSFFFLEKTPLKDKKFIKRKWGKFWFVLSLGTFYSLILSLANIGNMQTIPSFITYQMKLFNSYCITLIVYHTLAKYIILKYFTKKKEIVA